MYSTLYLPINKNSDRVMCMLATQKPVVAVVWLDFVQTDPSYWPAFLCCALNVIICCLVYSKHVPISATHFIVVYKTSHCSVCVYVYLPWYYNTIPHLWLCSPWLGVVRLLSSSWWAKCAWIYKYFREYVMNLCWLCHLYAVDCLLPHSTSHVTCKK